MSSNEPFDQYPFLISAELIQLLLWLSQNEQEGLKKLVKKSLASGLKDLFEKNKEISIENHEDDFENNLIEFCTVLENLIFEFNETDQTQKTLERRLIPALDHIDRTVCDTATISACAAKVTDNPLTKNSALMQKTLYKELLKRWKPKKQLQAN